MITTLPQAEFTFLARSDGAAKRYRVYKKLLCLNRTLITICSAMWGPVWGPMDVSEGDENL